MDWKKFAGPAILAGLAILIYQAVNVSGHMLYDEGDTVDDEFVLTSCCMGLLSILMCLGSIVWFAFALGTKTQKTVFLSEDPDNFQHVSVPLAGDAQSTVVPSAIGGGPVSYVREKIIITKSEGDTAQMVGFFIIAGSVVMPFITSGYEGVDVNTERDWWYLEHLIEQGDARLPVVKQSPFFKQE